MIEFKPQPEETPKEYRKRIIGESIGYASMCWTTRVVEEGKYGRPDITERVFDSERASQLVDALDAALDDSRYYPDGEPLTDLPEPY